MPSDVTDLARRLLDAQVAYLVAELTGPDGAGVIAEAVGGVLAGLDDVTVGDLVDRDALAATAGTLLDTIGPSPAIEAFVSTVAPLLHGLPASDEHRLGDVVDRAHVEALVGELARSATLRDEILGRIGRSPTVAALSLRFVSALVGDAVQQNRKRAERVPGAKLALGMGDFAARQARGLAPKQLEQVLGGAADKGAHVAMERVTRALVETLDPEVVLHAVMEVWDLHASDRIGGLRAYLTEDEVSAVASAGHAAWVGSHRAPWVRSAVEAVLGAFLDRFGDVTVGGLLTELGLDVDVVLVEVQRHAPLLHAALLRDGHLEQLIRDRLEPFFSSAELKSILES